VWLNSPDSKVSAVWDSLQMLKDLLKMRLYYYRPGMARA